MNYFSHTIEDRMTYHQMKLDECKAMFEFHETKLRELKDFKKKVTQ
jgi:hypothetical protein